MNLGEILDRTVEIYRSRFLLFLGVAVLPPLTAALVLLVCVLLTRLGLVLHATGASKTTLKAFGAWLADDGLALYFYCLMWPVYAWLVSRVALKEPVTLAAGLRWFSVEWRKCIGLVAVIWASVYVLPHSLNSASSIHSVALSYAQQLVGVEGPRAFQLGSNLINLAALAVGALACVLLAAAVPALVIEGLPFSDALGRGGVLATRGRLRILGAWVLAGALRIVFGNGFGLLMILTLRTIKWFYPREAAYLFFDFLSEYGSSILVAPVFPIALTLFYYDQRVRREAFDIERMMDAAGMNNAANPPAESTESTTI